MFNKVLTQRHYHEKKKAFGEQMGKKSKLKVFFQIILLSKNSPILL